MTSNIESKYLFPGRRGDEIERRSIDPAGLASWEASMPAEWVEPVEYEQVLDEFIQKVGAQALARQKWSYRLKFAAQGAIALAGVAFPGIGPLTKHINTALQYRMEVIMPKEKAARFFAKFQAAEGLKKWIYGAGAIVAFGLSFVDVSFSIYVLAGLAGVEFVISRYEQLAAKEAEDE